MFERFTDRARRVLVLAQDEARVLEHNFLGTEHVLLGLIKEGEGVGAKALQALGTDYPTLHAKVTAVITPGAPGTASGAPPFTPRAKRVLELALSEALELGHNYIGTEHLLLGLIREGEGVASQVLVAQGLALATVRAKVTELLVGFAATNPMPRSTPAGTMLSTRAKAIAGVNALGSHHYLLALLEDPNCLAARVLSSFGVTLEAAGSRVNEMGVAGTTDDLPAEKVSPSDLPSKTPFQFQFGAGVSLHVNDEQAAMRIVQALQHEVVTTSEGQADVIGSVVGKVIADAVGEAPSTEKQPEPEDNDGDDDETDAASSE